MSTISPVLDQPQSLDYELAPTGPINRLANQELFCLVDANSDAYDVTWPWADAVYARRIRLTITDYQDGVLTPLAIRLFPGHQETIVGSEGMIVTKRLVTPWKSPDDRALIWLLACQAEGDRLLRLDVEIDWGEPLSQRIVDGLLVAQRNPEEARGIYAQSNAESTRVFGNPHGRADEVHIEDPQHARLVYHVLVNGEVEVPLMLTMSDVGEQVAWNGFLSLRDVEQVFDASTEAWTRLLRLGRLWTPDPAFNQAVHEGKLEAIRRVQRLRTGWAPTGARVTSVAALIGAWDAVDPAVSRNLLAHLRRVAERTGGALPEVLPALPPPATTPEPGSTAAPDVPPVDLGDAPAACAAALHGNTAYLRGLHQHLLHLFDREVVDAHQAAVRLCAERLIQLRLLASAGDQPAPWWDAATCALGLQVAAKLAHAGGDEVDAARWESEVRYLNEQVNATLLAPSPAGRVAGNGAGPGASAAPVLDDWTTRVELAGAAVWDGCGVGYRDGALWVEPAWPSGGGWWALLSLPIAGGKHLSLLWDGSTLHATQPVRSSLPVALYKRIQLQHADEYDFDPVFELTRDSTSGDTAPTWRFKPQFRTS